MYDQKGEGTSMSLAEALKGRINDADSHEAIPAKLWPSCFGESGTILYMAAQAIDANGLADLLADIDSDEVPITYDSVWKRSGWDGEFVKAPGAIDMKRRVDVLDCMGVRRQLVFPGFGMLAHVLATASPALVATVMGVDPSIFDPEEVRRIGIAGRRAYNDWVMERNKVDPDRLRMVAIVPTVDFDEMMSETEKLLAAGIRSLCISAGVPPGGKSPANRDISPFWSLCEEANATVFLHQALEEFFHTMAWRNVPEFELEATVSAEFVVDPWTMATSHMVAENFLLTMILGGVFERHPTLRFGVIECGAHWIGPLAASLDMWAGVFKRRMSKALSLPPSAYISRNVRVTPFYFEPVGEYIERYGLEDVYCYGSDYPHVEGGREQFQTFAKTLGPLGDSVMEKFFVTNSELIMPALPQAQGAA
jgi:predicted TIM-barrel fold metal-dependent hydrolase